MPKPMNKSEVRDAISNMRHMLKSVELCLQQDDWPGVQFYLECIEGTAGVPADDISRSLDN